MSKRFKTQDYFRYRRLGTKWRKSKGRQSKLRIRKGGSGLRPSVGYGTEKSKRNLVHGLRVTNVSSANQLQNLTERHGIIIAGSVGGKNALEIYKAAKEKGLKILNMKKVKKALKREEEIRKRHEEKAKAKEKIKAEAKKTEESEEEKQSAMQK